MYVLFACVGTPDDSAAKPEPCVETPRYADEDGDGAGDPAANFTACTGGVPTGLDCDDRDPATHPGADETCGDGVDADCDGVDPDCVVPDVNDADVRILGDAPTMDLGRILRIADVDLDGQPDIVSGTYRMNGTTGGALVLPGPVTSGNASDLGWRYTGRPGSATGRSMSLGDIDGDGDLDLGLGAPYGAPDGLYVVFGPLTGPVSVADPAVALLEAPAGWYGGHGSDLEGDVDGDGIADVVVSAYLSADKRGYVYTRFGPVTAGFDLEEEADAILVGEDAPVYAGRVVETGGDLDGDGVRDLVIGCLGTLAATSSGGMYVVFGPPGDMDLADADARIVGEGAYSEAGLFIDTADLDADGLDDIAVAAFDTTLVPSGGSAYVVPGPAAGAQVLDTAAIIVRGDKVDHFGGGVGLDDLDADGRPDLLLGASANEAAGMGAGAVFAFLGPSPGEYLFADADLSWIAEGPGDDLGTGFAVGEVTGDGLPDLVLGSPQYGSGGEGAIYVIAGR